jgi:hypothetical protein
MLNELHNIRRLLTSPGPENVRTANAELAKLPDAVNELAARLMAKRVTRDDVKSLVGLRSELASILLLAAAALEYFTRLGLLRATGFSDYEYTGELRPLAMASRTIGQL